MDLLTENKAHTTFDLPKRSNLQIYFAAALAIARAAAARAWPIQILISLLMLGAIVDSFMDSNLEPLEIELFMLPAMYTFMLFTKFGINLRSMAAATYRTTPAYPHCFFIASVILFVIFCLCPSLLLFRHGIVGVTQSLLLQLAMAVFALSIINVRKSLLWAPVIYCIAYASLYYYVQAHAGDTIKLLEGDQFAAVALCFAALIFMCVTFEFETRPSLTLQFADSTQSFSDTSNTAYSPSSGFHKIKLSSDRPNWWWIRYGTMRQLPLKRFVIPNTFNILAFILMSRLLDGVEIDLYLKLVYCAATLVSLYSMLLFPSAQIQKVKIRFGKFSMLYYGAIFRRLYLQNPHSSRELFLQDISKLCLYRFLLFTVLLALICWGADILLPHEQIRYEHWLHIPLCSVLGYCLFQISTTWAVIFERHKDEYLALYFGLVCIALSLVVYISLGLVGGIYIVAVSLVTLVLVFYMYHTWMVWSRSDIEL